MPNIAPILMAVQRQTESSKGKLECSRFRLNIRKHFFTVRVTQNWDRFPGEVVESLFLEILKTCLDMVLGSQLWVALLEQGFGQEDLQRCFPSSASLRLLKSKAVNANKNAILCFVRHQRELLLPALTEISFFKAACHEGDFQGHTEEVKMTNVEAV